MVIMMSWSSNGPGVAEEMNKPLRWKAPMVQQKREVVEWVGQKLSVAVVRVVVKEFSTHGTGKYIGRL